MSRVLISFSIVLVVFAHVCVGGYQRKPPPCEVNCEPSPCDKHCEATCENPHKIICTPHYEKGCKHQCQCVAGYVRHKGTCIKIRDCPPPPPPPQRECSCNETLSLCGHLCEPSCANKKPKNCPAIECCKETEACRCKEGYVRVDETLCIKVTECPPPPPPPPPPKKCSCNETLALCGCICEPTCINPKPICYSEIACSKKTEDCRCKNGYVRHKGRCIKLCDCPPPPPPPPPPKHCSCNETLSLCGRISEPTCLIPNPKPCSKDACHEHTKACRCKAGYVRNPKTNKCVHPCDCVTCGVNEKCGACDKLCEGTCKNKDCNTCVPVRCKGYGCQCKHGFFRNENTGKCVKAGHCPKKCGYGEINAPCGRTCEATCKHPYCPKICDNIKCYATGCRCDLDAGFVRDKSCDKCVLKKNCPYCDDD